VQKNYALVRHKHKKSDYADEAAQAKRTEQMYNRKPNADILEHERKRAIELKVAEMEDYMEEQGCVACARARPTRATIWLRPLSTLVLAPARCWLPHLLGGSRAPPFGLQVPRGRNRGETGGDAQGNERKACAGAEEKLAVRARVLSRGGLATWLQQ